MFQYYSALVDYKSEEFQRFLGERLPPDILGAPRSVPYRELYRMLKDLIHEFAKKKGEKAKSKSGTGT